MCHFGSCAEVISDGGTEFAGEFDELLKMSLIDHRRAAPNHPQADGLAERPVQTNKRVLKNVCEESQTPKLWDKTMPWLVFGYNCTHKASTKMSPYFMLCARHPAIPPVQMHNFTLPIDLDNVEELVKSVLHRAKIAEKQEYLQART